MAVIEEPVNDDAQRPRDAKTLIQRNPSLPSYNNKDALFECPESHEGLGREFFNIAIDMPPEAVFNLIYRNQEFIEEIYANRKYTDFSTTPWEKNENGEETRLFICRAALPKIALGSSSSLATQIQTLSKSSCEPHLYIVNCEITNKEVPYCDYFFIQTHVCIAREVNSQLQGRAQAQQSRVTYFANVKFKKNPIFFAKNLIEKQAMAGLEMITTDIMQALEEEAEKASENMDALRKGISLRKSRKDGILNDAKKKSTKEEGKSKNSSVGSTMCGWVIVLLLVGVISVNVYLYTKLSVLDQLFLHKMYLSRSAAEDVTMDKGRLPLSGALPGLLQSLKNQEKLIQKHSVKWKDHLVKAVDNLKEVETILEDMLASLPDYLEEQNRMEVLTATHQSLEEFESTVNLEQNEEKRKEQIPSNPQIHRT